MTTDSTLSFSDLERRIRAMPDGPAGVLNTPSWISAWSVIGTVGIILGLLPALLVKLMDPQMWMVDMAHVGVGAAAVGYLPGIVRGIWAVARSMWRWKDEHPQQLDHDLGHFRAMTQELAKHPATALSEHLRFVQSVQTSLTARLGFLVGSLDKLGVLPILFAAGIQLQAFNDLDAVPSWQVVLGLFFAVAYLIAMIGSLRRQRLQLYEAILTDALEACHASGGVANGKGASVPSTT